MSDELELGTEGSPEATIEIDDTEGELVIRDSNDNEVARRDESAGTWVLDSVSTESLVSERHYAGGFEGSDADTRLDNALSAASFGDVIYLEGAEYADDRTIGKAITFDGSGQNPNSSTLISGNWTIDERVVARNIVHTGDMDLSFPEVVLLTVKNTNGAITTNGQANNCRLLNISGGSVTFDSADSGCILDASTGVSVSGNTADNTVGTNG